MSSRTRSRKRASSGATLTPEGPDQGDVEPRLAAEAVPEEEVEGELLEDPKIQRAIELSVQQNIQNHLHLRERDLLPDAEELRHFDQVVPGLAARVADEWQQESAHRRDMDRKVFDGQLAGYKRYQWFAFLLILALIGASVYLFSIGQDVIAFLLALTTAASVVVRALLAFAADKMGDDDKEEQSKDE